MKKSMFVFSLLLLPSLATADIAIQEDYAITGKIFAVKTAKNILRLKAAQKLHFKRVK